MKDIMVFMKQQACDAFSAETKADDQWTFQQGSRPKELLKGTVHPPQKKRKFCTILYMNG